ncbi:MAG: glycoside hydrolase family 13 protein [Melioribacteraceae bacterium]|nr:glycoside hydrolase family 13 protein [Melioribacteraceae bacterium]MCF8356508.1 glycoside hydrolase family 13 protein [Melioribacteraceae bacterium]MCF8395895.1 glycoside hydrolase family 13 protein [Melioribacteraceae bacterium]
MQTNKQNEFVPQWAKSVVWYQIFPERFRNGDSSNDPQLKDIKGSYPHENNSPWQIHPWTSDWYKLQPYEKKNGKSIWFNLQRRRYGGDIQGIIDKLDYLQNLGVTALYLNPVFESPSLHKYDGATFHHVDPNFGPDPEGDRSLISSEVPHDPSTWVWTSADKLFLKLVEEVHMRDMKIVIDGVFNHMGINSWAFKDVVEKQQNSEYKNWFKIRSWDDEEEGTEFQYDGWYGVKELPELNQDENGITEDPRRYIFNITRRWMDPDADGNPADGIDGWRLDVAFMIKHPFWKMWRNFVKTVNSEAYITAEIIESVEANKPYLSGDEFDAVMNYNFAFACAEYFINEKNRILTTEFNNKLKELRNAYPQSVAYVMQNLFDSHDTNRLLSHILNRDLHPYNDWGNYYNISKGENPDYNTGCPGYKEFQIMKLMTIFQMTYVGAPMIYYGDEAGMWGANDPCSRKPMVWDDMNYENEKFLPDQSERKKECIVEFNEDIFNHYKKLIRIRNENPVLQLGDFTAVMVDNAKQVYVFERTYEDQKAIVAINNSTEKHLIKIRTGDTSTYIDYLNDEKEFEGQFSFEVYLPPKWGRILIKEVSY